VRYTDWRTSTFREPSTEVLRYFHLSASADKTYAPLGKAAENKDRLTANYSPASKRFSCNRAAATRTVRTRVTSAESRQN
jgi:hypothetical protein